jgi:hypothetical protein
VKRFDTFVLEISSLHDRVKHGRLYPGGTLDLAVAAQPEADRLPLVDALATWKDHRDRDCCNDWVRATWPTLLEAKTHAAYLAAEAAKTPARSEEARLFAAFVEALPAAWAGVGKAEVK